MVDTTPIVMAFESFQKHAKDENAAALLTIAWVLRESLDNNLPLKFDEVGEAITALGTNIRKVSG